MHGFPIGHEFRLNFYLFFFSFSGVSQRPSTVTIWTISYARSRAKAQATFIVYRNLFTHFINYRMHRVLRMPPKQPAFALRSKPTQIGHPIYTTTLNSTPTQTPISKVALDSLSVIREGEGDRGNARSPYGHGYNDPSITRVYRMIRGTSQIFQCTWYVPWAEHGQLQNELNTKKLILNS